MTAPRARATLHAGGFRTEYLAAGRGTTVLVLLDDGGESALAQALLDALAPRFRAIVPIRAPSPSELGHLLVALLEGLGTEQLMLVAHGALGEAALEFSVRHPGCVRRLALLVEGAAPPPRDGASLVAVPAHAGVSELRQVASAVLTALG